MAGSIGTQGAEDDEDDFGDIQDSVQGGSGGAQGFGGQGGGAQGGAIPSSGQPGPNAGQVNPSQLQPQQNAGQAGASNNQSQQSAGQANPSQQSQQNAGQVGASGNQTRQQNASQVGASSPLDPTGSDLVTRLYDTAFDRQPDQNGYSYHTSRLDALSPLQVAADFLASPEGQEYFGALGDAAFVQQLYQGAFDREADAEGLGYWTGQLERGTSRAAVLLGVSESPEHKALLPDLAVSGQVQV